MQCGTNTTAIVMTLSERLAHRIQTCSPHMVLFGAMFAGLLLLPFAAAVDLMSVKSPKGREVGFGLALNWSIVYVLLLPFFLYFLVLLVQGVPHVLRVLADRKMLRDSDLEPTPADPLIDHWNRNVSRMTKVWLWCGIGLGMSFSLIEWGATSLWPLVTHGTGDAIQDWSTAAVWRATQDSYMLSALANGAFSLVAFLFQAVLIAVIVGFVLFMVYFSELIHHERDSTTSIVPDLGSDDERRGFQHLEPLLVRVLSATMAAYLMAYLSRLQKLYLHSEGYSETLWQYVKDFVVAGFASSRLAMFDTDLFGEGATTGPGTVIVIIATMAVFAMVLIVIARTLAEVAESARRRVRGQRNFIAAESVRLQLNSAEVTKRINSMKIWPLQYPTFNFLVILVGFAVACLVFYRIGLFTFGAIVAVLMWKAFGGLGLRRTE